MIWRRKAHGRSRGGEYAAGIYLSKTEGSPPASPCHRRRTGLGATEGEKAWKIAGVKGEEDSFENFRTQNEGVYVNFLLEYLH